MGTAKQKTALIIGGGPAGLTAALELLRRTDVRPVILERSATCGGMGQCYPLGSGTVDVGGHRFHTASQRVRDFWLSVMGVNEEGFREQRRRSLLLFEGKHFAYPVRLTPAAILGLGPLRSARVGLSLLNTKKRPIVSLEDFFRQTYGDELYRLFFESYTEKVWGRASGDIPATWASERLRRPNRSGGSSTFLYPRGGPGKFWDCVAAEVLRLGGEIRTGISVEAIEGTCVRTSEGEVEGDFILSTMPLAKLCELLEPSQRFELPYRSLVSVNLVLERSRVQSPPAQWIYVNDQRVRAARLQYYRQWDESMVPAAQEEIVGVEFFAARGDDLWDATDRELEARALRELAVLGVYRGEAVASRVVRYEHAYPCYWGDYPRLSVLQDVVDRHPRVFSFGRQGLHRYINMDQAMMSALRVVDHIRDEQRDKKPLWEDFSHLHLPE